ncbi:MAG TPA: M1 family metallopeptidase [Steroidobacteraceae bacterium]|nr:M1 family metallopeptidase [Steroidobacteraceae bacterium]
MKKLLVSLIASIPTFATAAAPASPTPDPIIPSKDYHSYADPSAFRTTHLDLDLSVSFVDKRLSGVADLTLTRLTPDAHKLTLDTRDLVIRQVWWLRGASDLVALRFTIGARDPLLGAPLNIDLPAEASASELKVRISYQTRPEASGLQWVEPALTADKTDPFLFTQSQAIHARSWIPLQDSPQIRLTYDATLRVPKGMRAVMSAESVTNPLELAPDGVFRFHMPQAVPSYLVALGVGNLEFRATGPRTGVYAEKSVIDAAAKEFAETEQMLQVSEKLFGAYRWGRYDLLILPPSFPFGGMENPRLSFITPTVIAGDRSLTAVIAHELAHSWSGNLVTNATWRDLWLNEGFTTYLQGRIVEAVYGARREAMEEVLDLATLRDDLAKLPPSDQVLAIDLRDRDPDDVFSQVAYVKGSLFIRWLTARFGTDTVDAFLHDYFDHFQFQSIATEQFRAYLEANLLPKKPGAVIAAELDEWLLKPGLPKTAVLPQSDAFAKVDAQRQDWLGGMPATDLPGADWTTHEWVHFIDRLPAKVAANRLAELDAAFHLTDAGNAEIAFSWLRVAIRNDYAPAWPRLENYLTTIGRRRLIKPLYEDLLKTPAGAARARAIYAKARPNYHPIAVSALDPLLRPR